VKEQTVGVFAERLAEAGFVTLAYDSSYQGASGGTPHFLDESMNRVDDVYSAVDYMTTLPMWTLGGSVFLASAPAGALR
jgi:uncharacterized protein